MQVRKITLNYFNKNLIKIIPTWFKIWDDSPWANFKATFESQIEYLGKYIKKGIGLRLIDNNKIIGFLFGQINSYKKPENEYEKDLFSKELKNNSFATIDELVIDKNYRGKNLGEKLFQKYETILKEKKISKILLYTLTESNSENFYRRLGFNKIGIMNKVNRPDLKNGFENRVYYLKYIK